MRDKYKKYEFHPSELSEKAWEVYTSSDIRFYKMKNEEVYLYAYGCSTDIRKVGTLEDVINFLED